MSVRPEERPRAGSRKRCNEIKDDGNICNGWARRGSAKCTDHGGGTRTAKKHRFDEESGKFVEKLTGAVRVPPRMALFLDGKIDVSELDEEELARGYPRASDGTFRAPPVVIPRIIYDRCLRELFARSDAKLKENLVAAVETLTSIATNPKVDPAQRIKAANIILERVRGKTPDVVITTETKKWEDVMEGVLRGPRAASDADDIIDAEIVDDGREP